jgi:hypothetical protein
MLPILGALVALFWVSFPGDHKELSAPIVDFEWCFIVPNLLWIVAPLLVTSHWVPTRSLKGRPPRLRQKELSFT